MGKASYNVTRREPTVQRSFQAVIIRLDVFDDHTLYLNKSQILYSFLKYPLFKIYMYTFCGKKKDEYDCQIPVHEFWCQWLLMKIWYHKFAILLLPKFSLKVVAWVQIKISECWRCSKPPQEILTVVRPKSRTVWLTSLYIADRWAKNIHAKTFQLQIKQNNICTNGNAFLTFSYVNICQIVLVTKPHCGNYREYWQHVFYWRLKLNNTSIVLLVFG